MEQLVGGGGGGGGGGELYARHKRCVLTGAVLFLQGFTLSKGFARQIIDGWFRQSGLESISPHFSVLVHWDCCGRRSGVSHSQLNGITVYSSRPTFQTSPLVPSVPDLFHRHDINH